MRLSKRWERAVLSLVRSVEVHVGKRLEEMSVEEFDRGYAEIAGRLTREQRRGLKKLKAESAAIRRAA